MSQVTITSREAVEPVEMLPGVLRRTTGYTDRLMICEFEIAAGSVFPEHSHPHDQIGYVISGSITLIIDGERHTCRAGDTYTIPGGVVHGAEIDEDCILIDGFVPAREEYK